MECAELSLGISFSEVEQISAVAFTGEYYRKLGEAYPELSGKLASLIQVKEIQKLSTDKGLENPKIEICVASESGTVGDPVSVEIVRTMFNHLADVSEQFISLHYEQQVEIERYDAVGSSSAQPPIGDKDNR
ncbi:hypothetical protein GCM10025776_02580 [Corallincola platygyrae]